MPPYPEISRRLGERGLTILDISVNERGEIDGVKVAHSSGSDRLDQAAADFAKSNWHFTPIISGGIAKPGTTIEQVDWDALR
jgi:protein TonB